MPRTALHSDDIKIEQKAPISTDKPRDRESDVVVAEKVVDAAWADEMLFNDEPVTIRLEPSTEKNAAKVFPVWVNGKGAEILSNGKWFEVGYLPVGQQITIKRKCLAVIAMAKIDTISTDKTEPEDVRPDRPNNVIGRITSAVHSFSVIEDRNPLGAAWLTEIRRRNFG